MKRMIAFCLRWLPIVWVGALLLLPELGFAQMSNVQSSAGKIDSAFRIIAGIVIGILLIILLIRTIMGFMSDQPGVGIRRLGFLILVGIIVALFNIFMKDLIGLGANPTDYKLP